MDKFSEVVRDAHPNTTVFILGKGAEFQFVSLLGGPSVEEIQRSLEGRDLRFIGVIGLVGGAPRVALAVELDPATASTLSQSYLQFIGTRLFPQQNGAN